MEPKFQSSFIPKGPASSTSSPLGVRGAPRDIVSFLAGLIFTISLILAVGVFAYKYYLNYRIDRMGAELESARTALSPETIDELVRLNDRIVSVEDLVSKHRVVSPVFDYLSSVTPKTVRYIEFSFAVTDKTLDLNVRGEARSYSALATLSQTLHQTDNFQKPVFTNLSLDEKGNVLFTLSVVVNPDLISYNKNLDKIAAPVLTPSALLPQTSTSTTATSSGSKITN